MKDFIIKIKNAINRDTDINENISLDDETLPFLFLITFIKAFIWFFIIIFIFIAIITVPIWGIPYSLYCVFRKSYNKELI